jgi:ribulose 1,5-bisphosphate carboxylase large subunit-like protein
MLAVVVIALRTVVEVGVMLVVVVVVAVEVMVKETIAVALVVDIFRVGLVACRAMRHFNEVIVLLHFFHTDSAFRKSGSRT